MKNLLSKLLVLLILFNSIIPTTAFADDNVVIYNCGYAVEFENGIQEYNGKIYICKDDLNQIYLDTEDDFIWDHTYDTELAVYPGSNIIEVNGISMLYTNAAIIINGDTYISLDLLAMLYSDLYDVAGNQINIWISKTYSQNFVKGTIVLPKGKVAPEGGLSVDVFVTNPKGSANSGAGAGGGTGASTPSYVTSTSRIGNAGFNGTEKPSYEDLEVSASVPVNYERLVEKTIVIPAGYNRVEFNLYEIDGDFTGARVGYRTEVNGYTCGETIRFNRRLESYDFTLNTNKAYIKGTVTIPEASEDYVKYTVVAQGNNGYRFDGVISAGEVSNEYSMLVDCDDIYSMLVLFENGEYQRTYLQEDIEIAEETTTNVDFVVDKAVEYNVTMTLPEDYDANEDVEMTVHIQSATSPYYYLDSVSATIPVGESSADVLLCDDWGAKNLICYYTLENEYQGLFDFGHYNSNGTTFDSGKADYIDSSNCDIEIPLLKTKQINAHITLPDDEVAESDVYVDIEPITTSFPIDSSGNMAIVTSPSADEEGEEVTEITYYPSGDKSVDYIVSDGDSVVGVTPIVSGDSIKLMSVSSGASSGISGGGGGGSMGGSVPVTPVVVKPTIAEGDRTGNIIISIPDEEGYGYILEVDVSDSAEKYYKRIYYNNKKCTVLMDGATTVSTEDESIEIELMKQYLVSGNVNAVGYTDSYNRIYAIRQKNQSIRNDVYDSELSIYTDIYGNGNYELFVPDEFDDYIVKLYSFDDGDSIYYSNPKANENIEESELITINSDKTNINFDYDGYRPDLPVVLDVKNTDDMWVISMTAIGDFDVENVMNYIALYDDSGKLLSLKQGAAALTVQTTGTTKMGISVPAEEIDKAETVKLLTWSDMKPVSDIYYIKKESDDTPIEKHKIALLYAEEGCYDILREGIVCKMDTACVFVNKQAYLPLRAGAESFEWTISWDDSLQKVIIKGDNHIGEFIVDETTATIDGESININNPLMIINDRVMAPFGEISELFGYISETDSHGGSIAVYDTRNYLVVKALKYGLISDSFNSNMITDSVTRKQMADLVVNLYESVNMEITISKDHPYSDTKDENILKAYEIGIMNGYEDGTFNPEKTLTNAEMITILQRTLIASGIDIPTDFTAITEFNNFPIDGSHWATSIVYSMKKLGVLDNIFVSDIAINDNANIRDTLGICANCYDVLKK